MALVNTDSLISVSEANKLGVSGLVSDAEAGKERVILRNNRPVAAVVGIRHLDEEQQLRDDLVDITLLAARMLTASGARVSLDEVLERLGVTREELSEDG